MEFSVAGPSPNPLSLVDQYNHACLCPVASGEVDSSGESTARSRRAYLHLAQGIGHRREALVEANERLASLRLGEMQRIGEIHTAPPPLQCLCSQSRIRQCDARQTGKGGESGADPLAAEPITAPQHPFGFQ